MPLVKAIIRPNKVEHVKEALEKIGAGGVTVTEVRGHGHETGHHAIYRGVEYDTSMIPKAMVEVVVPDALSDDAVRAIMGAARTGAIGDGHVYVLPIEENYRIRTGHLAAD